MQKHELKQELEVLAGIYCNLHPEDRVLMMEFGKLRMRDFLNSSPQLTLVSNGESITDDLESVLAANPLPANVSQFRRRTG
jgi:hypothetical protein